jgi:hypothetical protein
MREQLKRKELRVVQLNSEFFSKAMILKADAPTADQDWRKLLQPQTIVPEKFTVRIEADGRSLVWTVNRGREFTQITNRLRKGPLQTIILLNGIEWTGDRQIFQNDTLTCKPLVALPAAGPAEPSAKAEASAFSIFVKASGEPEAWALRVGHEWEDFSQQVRDRLKFENFSASFNSRMWTEDSEPPSADQTVMVSPRLKAGAPKKRKEVDRDPELKEKVLGLILSSDYDWTTIAKLSPAQLKANEKVLDILEGLSRLESGPLHIGHILRILENETAIPFLNPGIQVQQKLGRDMTIKNVLMRLPISLCPPAYPSQCLHPECGKSKAQMCKTNHQNKDHNRKRDFINNVYQKLNGSYLFDGESCLTATTASLLNVTVIAPTKAAYSDAYKVGMGPEKQLNTIGDLQNTWLQEGRAEWHSQVGDFWGPILANLHARGGWLSISEEIFNTGTEHMFYPKEISENDAWRRRPHSEQREDDDPAQVVAT